MEIVLHNPANQKGHEEIKKRLACIKADIVINSIKSMNYNNEQKKSILNTVIFLLDDKL